MAGRGEHAASDLHLYSIGGSTSCLVVTPQAPSYRPHQPPHLSLIHPSQHSVSPGADLGYQGGGGGY